MPTNLKCLVSMLLNGSSIEDQDSLSHKPLSLFLRPFCLNARQNIRSLNPFVLKGLTLDFSVTYDGGS